AFLMNVLGLTSPVLHSLGLSADREYTCNTPWQQFRHLCWLPVPDTSSGQPHSHADLYCTQRDARALHLTQRHYCVKDAIRLRGDMTGYNLYGLDMGVMHKRLMGNNGY
ncbi:uncharacterized protein, partial [Littorina saxatilis]|uniref:uncharacterized protein n=1 Tax=Littorina saxatilis TaxID=31220 RepID=UPI0038B42ABC